MSVQEKTQRLRAAIKLLSDASEVVIKDWEEEERNPAPKQADGSSVPSHALHNARKRIQGAMGVCSELVLDPRARLMEMAIEFYEARALHIAAEVRVADILDSGDHEKGMSADEIGRRTGIKAHKIGEVFSYLSFVLLCSWWISYSTDPQGLVQFPCVPGGLL